MIGKSSLLVLLVFAGLSVGAFAQQSGESSIPDPTVLGEFASSPGSEIVSLGTSVSVESDRDLARFSAVEVIQSNVREFGVQVELKGEEQTQILYLNRDEASQLRNELASFRRWSPETGRGGNRVFGVARCRPSQSIRQAFCPAMYSYEGEHGVSISTTLSAYRFPAMESSEIVAALESALSDLDRAVLESVFGGPDTTDTE